MAKLLNRVKETISAGGTGNLTLSGAESGFQTFNTAAGLNSDFFYWIVDGTTAWECGIGYLSGTTTLVRKTRLDSSTGSAINASTASDVFSGEARQIVREGIGDNKLINPNMDFWQRGTTFTHTNTGGGVDTYGADRWKIQSSAFNGVVLSYDKETTSVPDGSSSAARLSVSSALAQQSAGIIAFAQHIEGYNIADAKWGSADAIDVTLTFWVRAFVAGVYSYTISDYSGSRWYTTEYTIAASNTWEKITITIPAETSGTNWALTNVEGFYSYIVLAAGTADMVTGAQEDTWQTSYQGIGTESQTHFPSSVSNTFYITQAKLEVAPTASAFEPRQPVHELMLCQRYFQKSYDLSVAPGTADNKGQLQILENAAATGAMYIPALFKATMREVPTIVLYDQNGDAGKVRKDTNGKTGIAANVGEMGFTGGTNDATSAATLSFQYTADAEF